MKKFLASLICCSALLCAAAPSRVIYLGGQAITPETHTLVLPATPTVTERWAAEEFNAHWNAMTGQTLPVAQEPNLPENQAPIFLGHCEGVAPLGLQPDWKTLGDEGIMIVSKGPALALVGGQRGVLYAVYDFLEQELGCRWFAEDCTYIPDSGEVRLDVLNRTYIPPFEYRDTDYPERRAPEFGVRNRLNGFFGCQEGGTRDAKWGNFIQYCGYVHTFDRLLPQSRFGEAHPEYYALRNGKRQLKTTQLCLTNPEVLQIVIEAVRELMRNHPDCKIFSVSQNDNQNYCECPDCTALAEEEGSQAGPLLHFVNAVADAVRDEFPDRIIDTLAYQYTRKPPKHVKPASNVAVRLCSIECCFVHPLEGDCPENLAFRKDIEEWNRLTNRLHIWDYVINYAHTEQPFPNLRVLQKNIDFFLRHGVTGIYEEANYFSRSGELAPLRSYLIAQCLWRPDFDVERGIQEFCDAYYGPASPAIQKYLKILHDTVCSDTQTHVTIYAPPAEYLNRPEMLAQLAECFDEAEVAAADAPLFLRRVKTARIPLTYTQLQLVMEIFFQKGDQLVNRGILPPAQLRRFVEDVREAGITAFFEGQRNADSLKTYLASLEEMAQDRTYQLVTLQNNYIRLLLLPSVGGRIISASTKLSNQPVFKIRGDLANGFNPFEDGYEEYAGGSYRGLGWNTAFQIVSQKDDEVKLVGQLLDGSRIERTISLTDVGFRVTSKVLCDDPRPAIPHRAHPCFHVSDTHNVDLWVKRADGWEKMPIDADASAGSELWLSGATLPAGAWGFTDRGTGLAILVTFRQPTVQTCYFFWNTKKSFVNLETFSLPAPLTASNGPVLDLEYTVLPFDQAPWRQQ